MRTKKSYYTSILLVIAIVVLANILSADFFTRLDLTETKRYTLSKATEDIVNELLEPVTVKAYFSENLPPNVAQTRQDFKDLLVEYASMSGGNLVYEFVNPGEAPELEEEANQAGISPVMINVREKDQVKQQKAYMGALIQMGDQQDVIPFMQPGEAMEYALTTSIKKIAIADKPAVGLIQGHGEPTSIEMQQAGQALNILYNFEDFTLTDSTDIPARFKTIAIVAPKDTIRDSHFARLDAFVARGGNILVACNRVNGDLQTAYGSVVNTGLEKWLERNGVRVESQFLVDASCASVTVQQQQGPFRFASQISFPYLPILNTFEEHAITKGLEAVIFPFASPLTFIGDSTKNYVPLAYSSEKSGTASAPTYFDIQKQWTDADFIAGKQTVAAAIENKSNNSKIVVIGDGDFAVNSRDGGQPQNLQADNVNLFVNAIDWLSDDTGLIELRTKGITSRPIDQLEDGTKSWLKYMNFALPILLVIIYGIVRMQLKRNLRVKRMQESYE